MNRQAVAKELVVVAKELTAAGIPKTVNDLLRVDDGEFRRVSRSLIREWERGSNILSYGIQFFSPDYGMSKDEIRAYWDRIPPLARALKKILEIRERQQKTNRPAREWGQRGKRYDEECDKCRRVTEVDNLTGLCRKCFNRMDRQAVAKVAAGWAQRFPEMTDAEWKALQKSQDEKFRQFEKEKSEYRKQVQDEWAKEDREWQELWENGMNRQTIAKQLIAAAKELTAEDKLWQKVARQYGEKLAVKLHSELLKKSADLSGDEHLNPTGELWVNEFMPVLMDGLLEGLKKQRRRY
jgi:hypothetical protein